MSKKKPWTRNQKLLLCGIIVALIVPLVVRLIPQRTGMDKEEIEKIAKKVVADYHEKHVEDFQGYQPDRDQLKAELTKALERTNSLAVKGNRTDAEKVLQDLRERGDLSSLQQMLIKERDKNHDMLVERNREIATVAYLRGDIDIAKSAAQEILRLDPNDPTALNQMGHIYMLQGNLVEAEKKYLRVYELGIDINDEELQAIALGNLGLVYQTRGDLNKAEQMYNKSLEIGEKLGRLEIMATQYGNLGVIYRTRGDLDKAEQMHNNSLEIGEKLGQLGIVASGYGNLGLIYKTRGDLNKAEQMYNKSLEIFEKLGGLEGIARDYGNLGVIYVKRGDLDKAEQMLKKSLEINEKVEQLEGVAINYANLGILYEKSGQLKKARKHWEQALELFKKIGMKPEIEEVQGWIEELKDK